MSSHRGALEKPLIYALMRIYISEEENANYRIKGGRLYI